MGIQKLILSSAIAAGFWGLSAKADDIALIIANESYRNFNAIDGAGVVSETTSSFEDAGFSVMNISNGSEAQMKGALRQLERDHEEAQRIVVVLSGQFMTNGSATWFAPVDLRSPSLASVGFDALQLSTVLSYLEKKPGGAALFLANQKTGASVDATIRKGVGVLDIPQGVLVAEGTPAAIARALEDGFLEPDVSLADAANNAPNLKVSGFVSDLVAMNDSTGIVVTVGPADDPIATAAQEEVAFWNVVEEMGSKASYEAYLRRYPSGEYAVQAKQFLQVIADATPKYTPQEQAELDMALTRNDRRRIQEQLSLLDFDPRGIDGVFGKGSRAAIGRFQALNGLKGDGFVNPQTLAMLRRQSEKKAAQLAQDAEKAKRARDVADAQFWKQTGARGTEADYLAYLSKYPKGLYAEAARKELEQIEEENRASAKAAERAAWDTVRKQNTVQQYRQFLKEYPKGTFAKMARARIQELTASDEERALLAAAKREEDSLQMSASMKILIERKLQAIGLKTGKVDGVFNEATRKAIRKYQSARGLSQTGFITRRTVVRLMSE